LLPISNFLRPAAMFAIGALCFLQRTRVPVSLGLTIVLVFACWWLRHTPIYPVMFALALTSFVFCFAYRLRWFGYNRFGDYSYGLYLWGFPVQQTVLHLWPTMTAMQNTTISLPLALGLGVLSWHLIEEPALKLKRLPYALFERMPNRWVNGVTSLRLRVQSIGNTVLWRSWTPR
jgi:peptidoglycan/LPS O-acetylase OafA/YrhL